MANYTKTVDFAAKDALASGNPNKVAQGTQIDTEFNNIATAIATKLDSNDSNVAKFDGVVSTDNSSADEIGYKGIPQNIQTGNYTLVLSDAGKEIYYSSGHGSGDTLTIPANASVAFPVGTVIVITNDDSTNSMSIAITSDTLVWTGTGSTGARTLGAHGSVTLSKKTATRWHISGAGMT
jgi:hypothetical protein